MGNYSKDFRVRKRITINDIPPDLAAAIQKDVDRSGMSLTDTIVQILARRYKLPYETTKRPARTRIEPERLIIKVPEDIWYAVRIHAAQSGGTQRGVLIYALQQHYKLGIDLPRPLPPGTVARPKPRRKGKPDADLQSARP